MEEDQQFCLRWNNHQSTLISVFDTLFDNGKLVDCTLAAEGQFVKAHKVVLSACSPYFATLLTEQYDKHPIFILKDVKYQELRAMMDYMYRGEVNISQDQLAALLKAAESLQIKGLSDNRSGGDNSQKTSSAEHKHVSVPGKANVGYTLEQTKRARLGPSSAELHDVAGSREGSSSPTGTRKRRKIRRRSVDNVMADNHENSNSSQSIQINSSVPSSNVTGTISTSIATGPAVGGASSLPQGAGNLIASNVTKKTENVSKMGSNNDAITAADNEQNDEHDKQIGTVKKDQNHKRSSKVINLNEKETDIVIEPKSEYDDDGNDETVEDLTLDDEDMGLEDLDQAAGPSHGGEGSSQGYAQWQVDRSQDEVFMAAQEAQQRDPQVKYDKSEQTDMTPEEFELDDCLLESNDIVITQNKEGFVLHVKKLGNITTAKLATADEDQAAAAAVAVVSGHGHAHITDVTDVKPTLTTLTTSHIKLPSSECELINLKKAIPSTSTITGPIQTTTIITPQQLHQHQHQHQHQEHTNIVTANQQTINTLLGLRNVQIETKNLGSRIKYSRGKIITQQGNTTTVQMATEKHDPNDMSEKKYEIAEIDLNNPQASASIISDLVKYAEIDDIELPDGTKIGIGFAPQEMNEHMDTTQTGQLTEHHHHHHQHETSHSPEQITGHDQTITKSYTILTTRPMKQETTTTTYELSLSDSSMAQSEDNEGKLYVCRHCGKKYRWKSTLRRHENVECGGKEPCHPCPYCSYKAKQRGNLGVHVRKHHPEKPQLESKRGRNC